MQPRQCAFSNDARLEGSVRGLCPLPCLGGRTWRAVRRRPAGTWPLGADGPHSRRQVPMDGRHPNVPRLGRKRERLRLGRPWLATSEAPTPSEVARRLGNGIAATESCVTALYAALRFLHVPLPDLLAFVAKCRGDVDTIGAMAGAIWGAANGSGRIPPDLLRRLEQRHRIEQVGAALFQASAIRRIA